METTPLMLANAAIDDNFKMYRPTEAVLSLEKLYRRSSDEQKHAMFVAAISAYSTLRVRAQLPQSAP